MEENSIDLLNMGCELEWENSFLVREFNNINKMIPQKEAAFCDFKKRYIDNWKLGNRGKMFVEEEEKEFNELMEKSTLDKIPFFTISSENIWVNFFNKLSKKELFEFCTHYIYTQSVYVDIIVVAWNLYFNKIFPPNKKELQIFYLHIVDMMKIKEFNCALKIITILKY